jgi:hypothetical protein
VNVFISWSGERSRSVAVALKDWLPDVLQSSTAWMSEHDIDAGVRWSHRLTKVLEDSNIGVICLTPENQKAVWIIFEAGALTKSVHESRLIPYLLDMSPHDVESPLAQFQAVQANRDGTLRLLESINACCPDPLPKERLGRLFEKLWPDLAVRIKEALALGFPQNKLPARSDRDVINEMLEIVRSLAKSSDLPAMAGWEVNIEIDTRPLHGKGGHVKRFRLSQRQSVSDFLDNIYFYVNMHSEGEIIPVFTYGDVWLLKNTRTNKLYDHIGIEYCRTRGTFRDNTPLFKLGLEDNDRLEILRINQCSLDGSPDDVNA